MLAVDTGLAYLCARSVAAGVRQISSEYLELCVLVHTKLVPISETYLCTPIVPICFDLFINDLYSTHNSNTSVSRTNSEQAASGELAKDELDRERPKSAGERAGSSAQLR